MSTLVRTKIFAHGFVFVEKFDLGIKLPQLFSLLFTSGPIDDHDKHRNGRRDREGQNNKMPNRKTTHDFPLKSRTSKNAIRPRHLPGQAGSQDNQANRDQLVRKGEVNIDDTDQGRNT